MTARYVLDEREKNMLFYALGLATGATERGRGAPPFSAEDYVTLARRIGESKIIALEKGME